MKNLLKEDWVQIPEGGKRLIPILKNSLLSSILSFSYNDRQGKKGEG